jgi:tol-pal system protein YbgF
VISVAIRKTPAARALLVFTTLVAGSGCAHQQQQTIATQQQTIDSLQARLDEAERTNGRLTVRVEELEDSVFLLQDRVDANRIALQRKGIMGPRAQAHTQRAPQSRQAPGPAPETHWGKQQYDPNNPYVEGQHPVTRIPLSGTQDGGGWEARQQPAPREQQTEQDAYREQVPTSSVPTRGADDELVITEDEFRAFEREYGGETKKRKSSSSSSSSRRKAQPDVTDEKLPTTAQLKGEEQKSRKVPTTRKSALATYKDALAQYRSGDYAAALGGFEAFLDSAPQPDYVDNALYWIGECHYGLGDLKQAVSFFQRVLAEQPDGNKVPDAMLKMSLAYDRLGRGSDATRLLQDLTRQYPATNAGKLASQKLQERR